MITVIAPHARPEYTENLLANFRRQRGVGACLLVVENGLAVGCTPHSERVVPIRSDEHQADAMNTGIAWLHENGRGPWARFDDDDYYGPDYLADTLTLLGQARADAVGKRWGFVMFDDGLWRFNSPSEFTGGTLAARSTDVLPFLRRRDDDLDWCRRMRAQGASMHEGSAWGYCYDRRTREAPRVIPGCSVISRLGFGASDFYGALPFAAVDGRAARALRRVPGPTNDEVFAAMSAL